MAIKKVWINEGCISCGMCESICSTVFKIEDEALVIEGVNYAEFSDEIKEAAGSCPVDIIKFSE
jgi:ferredoxin